MIVRWYRLAQTACLLHSGSQAIRGMPHLVAFGFQLPADYPGQVQRIFDEKNRRH